MSDLVTRLRHYNSALMDEAADRINALEKALRDVTKDALDKGFDNCDGALPCAFARARLLVSQNTAFRGKAGEGVSE